MISSPWVVENLIYQSKIKLDNLGRYLRRYDIWLFKLFFLPTLCGNRGSFPVQNYVKIDSWVGGNRDRAACFKVGGLTRSGYGGGVTSSRECFLFSD